MKRYSTTICLLALTLSACSPDSGTMNILAKQAWDKESETFRMRASDTKNTTDRVNFAELGKLKFRSVDSYDCGERKWRDDKLECSVNMNVHDGSGRTQKISAHWLLKTNDSGWEIVKSGR